MATCRAHLMSVTWWGRSVREVKRVFRTSGDQVGRWRSFYWFSLQSSFVSSPTLWKRLFLGGLKESVRRSNCVWSEMTRVSLLGCEAMDTVGPWRAVILTHHTCISSAVYCCGISLANQKFNNIQKERPLVFSVCHKGREWSCPFHYEALLCSPER